MGEIFPAGSGVACLLVCVGLAIPRAAAAQARGVLQARAVVVDLRPSESVLREARARLFASPTGRQAPAPAEPTRLAVSSMWYAESAANSPAQPQAVVLTLVYLP